MLNGFDARGRLRGWPGEGVLMTWNLEGFVIDGGSNE